MKYQPPAPSPAILNRVAAISGAIGRFRARRSGRSLAAAAHQPYPHRSRVIGHQWQHFKRGAERRVLEGKRVIAPLREVQEVKRPWLPTNASAPGNQRPKRNCWRRTWILMSGLVDGTVLAWRRGVMAGNQVIHMAPPADLAPHLIAALFRWLATTDAHPLIASPVFHYEFERLHRGQRPHGAAVAE